MSSLLISADPRVPEKPLSASRHERTGSSNLVPVDPYDANSAEIMDVLAMLYFMVVVFNEDESFGDELSGCFIPPF